MTAMPGPVLLLLVALVLTACASVERAPAESTAPTPTLDAAPWPEPPPVPSEEPDPSVSAAAARLAMTGPGATPSADSLATIAASGDPRLAWLLSDLLRFAVTPDAEGALVDAFEQLTGADPRERRFGPNPWLAVTNLLIGWDLPAVAAYREHKATLLLALEPAWAPLFADAESTIDWRVTTWGGVFIDDRPSGSTEPCERACIPALDDPALTSAGEGGWYADDRIVFGISLGDEAVALPKHIMEVHEMVNLTLGGRRLGVPYCTLCASAQAYLTDAVPPGVEPLVLRTSGLLSRSNKVMYDLGTGSAFHTFTGRAASGPLRELDLTLEPVTVTVSTWGDWKAAHPDTRIVARDGGIGRVYPDDPLCGRDDAGPIFPIGPADTRLPVQAAVVGVIDPTGQPLAFAAATARDELEAGRPVSAGAVELILDGGGLSARGAGGEELVTHEAFWFAWSQFHPTTSLWAPPTAGPAGGATGAGSGGDQGAEDCSTLLDVLTRDPRGGDR